MGEKRNIIELNGNLYDAVTGRLIEKPTKAKKAAPKPTQTGGVVDGFTVRKSTRPNGSTGQAARGIHKKTERSKTLMRHAVSRPSQAKPKTEKPATKQASKVHNRVAPSLATARVDSERIKRAQQISQSKLINKFTNHRPGTLTNVTPLPVKPEPSAKAQAASQSTPKPTKPIDPASRFSNRMEPKQLFAKAIEQATSHEQPKLKKRSLKQRTARKLKNMPRAAVITMSVAITLVVGGAVAYQQVPQLAVRMASARAGISASLPDYQPAGFSLAGPIQYSAGQITFSYHSEQDDRDFRVVQKATDWNSQALLENFIAASNRAYQTFQAKGKTIYIYDGNNATWVNGGIWYQVEGESSSLNSDQLLRIADSL